LYVIQNVNMANYLIENGQPLLKIDRDKFDKFRLVFLFADTCNLRNAMSRFLRNGGSNNDSLKDSPAKMGCTQL
jgi:hypothetical protein